jgi:collagen type V/XI/XXIV/XXVII alpha
MGPTSRPANLIEYIWPCGHHENVEVQQAPGISFVRGQFSLPVAKPPEDFTEEERTGVPGRRKCCRCWATCSLFKPLEACEECDHPFAGCPTCMIVDSSGSREIATVERRPIGEFDQTPEFWRCNTCEHINPFDGEGPFNGFLAPKVSDYREDMQCRKCGESFVEDNWVINPYWVYLGTWNGRVVAEGGPWHWSLEWHRDRADESHTKDDCYATRRNGRRRRENPCINKNFASQPEKKGLVVPPILVVDTDHDHSLPPPSAGLTPFPEEHGYGSDRETAPEFQPEQSLHPDNQTMGTGAFTIGDYGGNDDEPELEDAQGDRGLAVIDDDQEADLGSYYNPPPGDEELPDQDGYLDEPEQSLEGEGYEDDQAAFDQVPDNGDYEDGQRGLDNDYEPSPEYDPSVEAEPPPEEGKHYLPTHDPFSVHETDSLSRASFSGRRRRSRRLPG